MTASQRTAAELGAGLLVLLAAFLGFRQHERTVGAQQVLLHAADSSAKVQVDSVARTAADAKTVADEASRAKVAALNQMVRSQAAAARAQSAAAAASAARDSADAVLRDSLASVAAVRAQLGQVLVASRADSAASAQALSAATGTIHALLTTITADSVALRAEQAHSAALTALNGTLTREVGLLKGQAPSGLAKAAWGILGAGAGYLIGHATK